MKHKGDALVLQVARNEPVNIKISGSGPFQLALQAEVGSPGSGMWRDIRGWSRKKEDKDDIEFSYSNPNDELQSLRLVVKEIDKGASVSASMEVPAEEEAKDDEPKLREEKKAELVEASAESIEAEKEQERAAAKVRGEGTTSSTSSTTTTTKPR